VIAIKGPKKPVYAADAAYTDCEEEELKGRKGYV
jgi:hypothetical protein